MFWSAAVAVSVLVLWYVCVLVEIQTSTTQCGHPQKHSAHHHTDPDWCDPQRDKNVSNPSPDTLTNLCTSNQHQSQQPTSYHYVCPRAALESDLGQMLAL